MAMAGFRFCGWVAGKSSRGNYHGGGQRVAGGGAGSGRRARALPGLNLCRNGAIGCETGSTRSGLLFLCQTRFYLVHPIRITGWTAEDGIKAGSESAPRGALPGLVTSLR
jgi:hypothetical protein